MILDFLVRNLLEQVLIFVTVAYLINRRHYIFSNWKRTLVSICAILSTSFALHFIRNLSDLPIMEYRLLIQIVLFAIIYMIAMKLNWLQSVIGILIVITILTLSDALGLIFLKFTDSSYNETTFRLNSQTLLSIIIMRTLQVVILIIITKFRIVIKIPDRFSIEKIVYKLVGSLVLLLYLVVGFLREVILESPKIQPVYILSIVASGGVLCAIIVDYVRKNALQLKEIDKTRRKVKTGEICTEIIKEKTSK